MLDLYWDSPYLLCTLAKLESRPGVYAEDQSVIKCCTTPPLSSTYVQPDVAFCVTRRAPEGEYKLDPVNFGPFTSMQWW